MVFGYGEWVHEEHTDGGKVGVGASAAEESQWIMCTSSADL